MSRTQRSRITSSIASIESHIDTPQVLIDLNVVTRNIQRVQEHCANLGMRVRPHIKTHKLPVLACAQLDAGAHGITCQKISEAEVMVDAGIDNILISYNIIGREKLRRLSELSARCSLTVVTDSLEVIAGLATEFVDINHSIAVLVELNSGMNRCGVSTIEEALGLARKITDFAPHLEFSGLMSYPAAGDGQSAIDMLTNFAVAFDKAGINCKVVSSGGTPDIFDIKNAGRVNEYRPGSYIYNDRSLIKRGKVTEDDCALSVLATIVSCSDNRVIIDAGSKALSSDLFGLNGFGLLRQHPEIEIVSLSEEHGHLVLPADCTRFKVGDTVQIIPNHVCVVSNLFDSITFVRGNEFISVEQVTARGCVT